MKLTDEFLDIAARGTAAVLSSLKNPSLSDPDPEHHAKLVAALDEFVLYLFLRGQRW